MEKFLCWPGFIIVWPYAYLHYQFWFWLWGILPNCVLFSFIFKSQCDSLFSYLPDQLFLYFLEFQCLQSSLPMSFMMLYQFINFRFVLLIWVVLDDSCVSCFIIYNYHQWQETYANCYLYENGRDRGLIKFLG